MPDKQSEENVRHESLGCKGCNAPANVDADDPRSYYKVSERLVQETENACYGNQYHNPSNPKAHYHSTGPELRSRLKVGWMSLSRAWERRNDCGVLSMF